MVVCVMIHDDFVASLLRSYRINGWHGRRSSRFPELRVGNTNSDPILAELPLLRSLAPDWSLQNRLLLDAVVKVQIDETVS